MNRDAIISMAKKAGLLRAGDGWTEPHRWGETEVRAFAALVVENFLQQSGEYLTNDASRKAAIKEAVEAEREECAKECERMVMYPNAKCESAAHENVWEAAAAIRARGQA